MNVLIVHAHPSDTSFNAAMTRRAVTTLTEAGHAVKVSDLHAMQFDPVSDRRNFTTVSDSEILNLQAEETFAYNNGGFVPELKDEMDKVEWCDVLIFQFPLWWLGLPAILKGWVDRVFACGFAYGGGRYYERGVFRGKAALCSLSVGGSRDTYSQGGSYDEIETVLYPIRRGIFEFLGFEVLAPFVAYGPGRMSQEERGAVLDDYAHRLLGLGKELDRCLRS